jgi:hypothetical protein
VTFQKGDERKALKSLVNKKLLKSEPGPKNSNLYTPIIQSPQSLPKPPHGETERQSSYVSPTSL